MPLRRSLFEPAVYCCWFAGSGGGRYRTAGTPEPFLFDSCLAALRRFGDFVAEVM